MSVTSKSPVAILNICELILTVICTLLTSGLKCLDCILTLQYVTGVVCGFIFVDIGNVATIFSAKSIDRNVRLLIVVLGSINWFCVSAILFSKAGNCRMEGIAIAAGILCLASSVARGVEGFFVFKETKS